MTILSSKPQFQHSRFSQNHHSKLKKLRHIIHFSTQLKISQSIEKKRKIHEITVSNRPGNISKLRNYGFSCQILEKSHQSVIKVCKFWWKCMDARRCRRCNATMFTSREWFPESDFPYSRFIILSKIHEIDF